MHWVECHSRKRVFFSPPVDVKVQLPSTLGSSSLLLMAEFNCLCDTKIYTKSCVWPLSLLNCLFNLHPWLIWPVSNYFIMSTKHCLHQLGCLKRILTLFTYIRAILVKQKRKWDTEENEECWNGARPLVPKVLVHLGGKQWKCSAEQWPKNGISRQYRSSIDSVCIQVRNFCVLDWMKDIDQNSQESTR